MQIGVDAHVECPLVGLLRLLAFLCAKSQIIVDGVVECLLDARGAIGLEVDPVAHTHHGAAKHLGIAVEFNRCEVTAI